MKMLPYALLLFVVLHTPLYAQAIDVDVCVYGGTSGGVVAAVQTSRMGKRVVLVEPGRHLGGLTSGGLSALGMIGEEARPAAECLEALSKGKHPQVIEGCVANGPGRPTGVREFSASRCSPSTIGCAGVNRTLARLAVARITGQEQSPLPLLEAIVKVTGDRQIRQQLSARIEAARADRPND